MKNEIAIIGATGFLGKAVVKFFKQKKAVIHLASLNGGRIESQRVASLDLTKKNAITKWMSSKNISCVIYLSSLLPAKPGDMNKKMLNDNVRMHRQILKEWKQKSFHLIYASSGSVYGSKNKMPFKETDAVYPDHEYSMSKWLGEQMFLQHDGQLTVLRIFAPYGYKDKNKTVVNIFFEKALRGEDLPLLGTGRRMQDFIYVDDVARAFWLAYSKRKFGTFNIASGTAVDMKALAKKIIKVTRSRSKVVMSGKPDPQEGKKVKIDVRRAKRQLGFTPMFNLEKGLKAMLAIYRKEYLSK